MSASDTTTTTSAPSPDAAPVTGMLGHLLRRTHQAHHVVWGETVGEVLTPRQYSALDAIAQSGPAGIDQSTVGERAALDRTTTTGVVQRLEEGHWITREPDPQDGRRRILRVTAPAELALEQLAGVVRRVQQRLLAPLADEDRTTLVRLLIALAGLKDDPGSTDLRPGHLIRRAQQRHTLLWTETQPGELTGPQFAVLGLLREEGPQVQGTLATTAALDRSNASDVIGRLQRRGLITRTAVPGDARSRLVALTEAGQEAVTQATPAALAVQQTLLGDLSADDRAQVTQLLGAVARIGESAPSGRS